MNPILNSLNLHHKICIINGKESDKFDLGVKKKSLQESNILGNESFQPPFKFFLQLGTQGDAQNALFKGRSTLVAILTTAACSGLEASFSYKNVARIE